MGSHSRGHSPVGSHHNQINFELAGGSQDSLGQEVGSHYELGRVLEASFGGQTFFQRLECPFAVGSFPLLELVSGDGGGGVSRQAR